MPRSNLIKNSQKINSDTQKTAPGINVYGGFFSTTDYEPTDFDTLLKDYVRMRNGDAVASSCLDALKLPILMSDWEIYLDPECKTEKSLQAKEYLDYCLYNLDGGFNAFKKHLLLAADFGSSWFEKVWTNGYDFKGIKTNMLTRLSPFMITSIYKYHYDSQGNFTGITFQKTDPDKGLVGFFEMDIKELFFYTYDAEFGDVRGRSVLRQNRLAMELKTRIMLADARAAERGAGIPYFQIKGEYGKLSSADAARIKLLAANIANSQNGYVISDDNAPMSLLRLEHQENNIERLKYYDSQSFYNTLTQFMSSGATNASGNRAQSEVLKSPYELKIKSIMFDIEERLNELCFEILQNSYLFPITREEMPIFAFKEAKNADITNAINTVINVSRAGGIKLNPQDEVWFRELFGMPQVEIQKLEEQSTGQAQQIGASAALYVPLLQSGVISAEEMRKFLGLETPTGFKAVPIQTQVSTPIIDNSQKNKVTAKMSQGCNHKNKIELMETPDKMSKVCKDIFELSSAIETFATIDEQAQKVVEDIYQKLVRDIASQLEEQPKRKPQMRFQGELMSKLTRLYNQARAKGIIDINKEMVKLYNADKIELESENIKSVNTDKRMSLIITGMYDNLNRSIQDDLSRQTVDSIESKGGLNRYIVDKFSDSQKNTRSDLISFTSGGYTAGRLEQLVKNSKYIDMYEYTAIMDKNVCEECAPLDGLQMTKEEIIQSGLNFRIGEQQVNPNCLGGKKCRCELVPIQLKDITIEDIQSMQPDEPVIVEPEIKQQETENQVAVKKDSIVNGINNSEQSKFIKGVAGFIGGSFLLLTPSQILANYAGTGTIISDNGLEVMEKIIAPEPLGTIKDKNGNEKETKNAIIHYGIGGVWIEPIL